MKLLYNHPPRQNGMTWRVSAGRRRTICSRSLSGQVVSGDVRPFALSMDSLHDRSLVAHTSYTVFSFYSRRGRWVAILFPSHIIISRQMKPKLGPSTRPKLSGARTSLTFTLVTESSQPSFDSSVDSQETIAPDVGPKISRRRWRDEEIRVQSNHTAVISRGSTVTSVKRAVTEHNKFTTSTDHLMGSNALEYLTESNQGRMYERTSAPTCL